MSLSRYRCLLILAVVTLWSASSAVAAQRAQIGVVTADGNVQLYHDRFQEKFADGTPVAEVRASISNGYLQLTRKGFDAQNSCFQHITHIVDAHGANLTSLNPGQQLYLPEFEAIEVSLCNDSGCDEEIPAPSRCNITEKSGGRCRCHIRGPSEEIFVSPDESLCWSWLDRITSLLSHWVKPSFIQTF